MRVDLAIGQEQVLDLIVRLERVAELKEQPCRGREHEAGSDQARAQRRSSRVELTHGLGAARPVAEFGAGVKAARPGRQGAARAARGIA
jgi:hypothetical protein